MLKICMVTTSEIYHDTRILNEAETLSRQYDVTILTKKYPAQIPKKYPFKIKIIDYWHNPFFRVNIFLSFLALMTTCLKEKADVYHAHDLDGLLCAFPAALIRRKILIYDSHEIWSDTYPFRNLRGIQWFLPILERLLIWKIKKGITVNESLARILSNQYHRQFLSLHNTLKINSFRTTSLNLRKEFPDKKIILHLGAADEGRGIEQIIEAAKLLPKSYVVIFIGGGKTGNEMKKLIQKSNLEKKIYFFSAIPPSEIVSTIKQADLALALTQPISKSYYYSLPNKVFQYIAAEIPILGSNLPEFKRIINQNKIGQTINPSKPKLIAKQIQKMTQENNWREYRRNLVGLSKIKYNWEKETKKLLEFYEELRSNAKRT